MTLFSSFSVFFQILINGVLFGSIYGIAAIGLSLIFGSLQIVFIAQGTVMILAAYLSFWLFSLGSLDPFASIFASVPLFLGIGWVFYRGLFHRVSGAGKNPSLLVAFGLMVLLESMMSLLWTPNPRAINTSYTAAGIHLGSVQISFTRLMAFFVTITATALVFLFLKKTLLGKAVRGAADDIVAASLLGISPRRIGALTFSIGIALAGVAGVAVATTYPFDPYAGFLFSLKALIAVAFGGIGSVQGALLGGILLGVIESLGSFMISGGWADAISYGAFLLVLMFRPEGLFGRSTA